MISDADTLVFANGYHIESTVEDMLKEAGALQDEPHFAEENSAPQAEENNSANE